MKNKLILIFLVFISLKLSAQDSTSFKRRLEFYIGGNNEDVAYTYYIDKNLKEASFITGGGMNFIGMRFDFIKLKNFQFGFDLMYNRVWANYFLPYQTVNSENIPYEFLMAVEERFYRTRLMARVNYILPISTDKFQVYFSGALGYLHSRVNVILSPLDAIKPEEALSKGSFLFESPVAFKLNAGMRYYFKPKIGVFMEFGFGGALATTGLTSRF